MEYREIIIKMLLEDSNRAQCLAILESTDGDLRANALARLNVLDKIQAEAQGEIHRATPPGMVISWELRDWYIEKKGSEGIHHIDFQLISDNKKHWWYDFQNAQVETQL
jgi:hypothetical protein